jgi:hypothetical protein
MEAEKLAPKKVVKLLENRVQLFGIDLLVESLVLEFEKDAMELFYFV